MIPFLALLLAATPPTPTPAPGATAPIAVLHAEQGKSSLASTGESLATVASRIKLHMPANRPRVIDNAVVKQLASGVELTTTSERPREEQVPPSGPRERASGKAMWQARYVAAVARAIRLEADVKRLTAEANRLQTDFYAEADPAQRDGVIKPAWDKTLANLADANRALDRARKEPNEIVNDARRAGGLPGWFRGLDQRAAAAASEPADSGAPTTPQGSAPPQPPNSPAQRPPSSK
jgi:hypothetical protein